MPRKKRVLDLSDIQDEADIYDRIVINQKRKRKPVKEDHYAEYEPALVPIRSLDAAKKPTASPEIEIAHDEEELPVVVESAEFQREKQVDAIPHVSLLCSHLLDVYEQTEMHSFFDVERNVTFRLFLHAVKHNVHPYFELSDDDRDLFVRLLREFAAKRDARNKMKASFVKEKYGSKPTKPAKLKKPAEAPTGFLPRWTRNIVVPKRIRDLLEE